MTPGQVNKMLKGFYNGTYDKKNLPAMYYKSFDGRMKREVSQAFGSKAGMKDLYADLSVSRQTFAAAKTFQMSRELQAAKRGAKSYDDYLERALPIYEKYETWGASEQNTAVANAQNAKQWAIIERDAETLPKLRYSAVMDGNTAPICASLNNLVLPVGHPMWKKCAPTNHYNCRCTLIQEDKSVRVTNKGKVETLSRLHDEQAGPLFKTNVGETKELFPPDHPYYTEVPQRDRAFARRNFDLPIK